MRVRVCRQGDREIRARCKEFVTVVDVELAGVCNVVLQDLVIKADGVKRRRVHGIKLLFNRSEFCNIPFASRAPGVARLHVHTIALLATVALISLTLDKTSLILSLEGVDTPIVAGVVALKVAVPDNVPHSPRCRGRRGPGSSCRASRLGVVPGVGFAKARRDEVDRAGESQSHERCCRSHREKQISRRKEMTEMSDG